MKYGREDVDFRPYNPSHDRWLYRGIYVFIASVSVLSIISAVILVLYDHHDIALAIMSLGSGGFGALITFFTQHK